jgi:hypothetical protein
MAMASVSWASAEMDPYDMAPVAKRFTMSETGSTASISSGGSTPSRSCNRPRSVARWRDWSSTSFVYCLKMS